MKPKDATPYVGLTLLSLPIFIMWTWMVIASFSKGLTLGLIPQEITIENWSFLWKPIPWGLEKEYIWPILSNTLLYSTGVMLLRTLACTLAGYALSRISFRGRMAVLGIKLLGRAVPGVGMLIGVYFVLYYIGLLFTIPGVVLLRTALGLPMAIWIMKGFFDGIPWDIEQAAFVDGCSRLGVWRRVILPLAMPGIAAVAILAFMDAWEDFIYVYVLLPTGTRVLSMLIQALIATEVIDWPLLSAMSMFYTMPPIVFYIVAQKYLTRVTIAGVKG